MKIFRRILMPIAFVSLMASCVPGADLGRVASNAAERAVESAVSRAVERTVRRITDRIFDLVIDQAIDGIFGAGGDGEVEFGPDFALDLYTGQYRVTLAGDAPIVGTFEVEASEPSDPDQDVSLGVGLRGIDDDGEEFLTVTLFYSEQGQEFAVTFIEGTEEDVVARIAGVSFDDGNVTYAGEARLDLIENTGERIAGSFSADDMTSEDAPGVVSVSADFDVPINPAGSLFIKRAEVESP